MRHQSDEILNLGMAMHYWVNHSETFSEPGINPFFDPTEEGKTITYINFIINVFT